MEASRCNKNIYDLFIYCVGFAVNRFFVFFLLNTFSLQLAVPIEWREQVETGPFDSETLREVYLGFLGLSVYKVCVGPKCFLF